jgi:CheY-like chemotaxis protein
MTATAPTLLIIDATPDDMARFRNYLKDEYVLLEAHNGGQGIALNQSAKPDCILLDHQLPDADGLAVLASLLANSASPCAIVVATNVDDTATAVQMLRSGAYDYLLKKNLSASTLRHSLRNALNDVALKRQLQEHRAALVARNRELEHALAATGVAQAKEQEFETRRSPEPPAQNKSQPASPRRILVVDDNHDNADSLSMMLGILGHDVNTAYHGTQAMDVAEKMRPEIILLDIGMPTISGYDVAQHVRRQPWGKSTVLIALTGWGQEKNRQESQAAGFNYHLVKPVHPETFVKLLAELDSTAHKGAASVRKA